MARTLLDHHITKDILRGRTNSGKILS